MAGTVVDPLLGFALDGRYEVTRQVATEQLGRVYLAKDRITNGIVNVKVLGQHEAASYEVMGRFGREMTASALVDHPHTVKMLDFGQHNLFHYLVTESLSAVSLASLLETKGTAKLSTVYAVAYQVASALELAHREKVIHRNLNPDTILLLKNVVGGGVFVKVRDFGLAQLNDDYGRADDGGLTTVNQRVGTMEYMAPEYIAENIVEPQGDVYSLGCVLYQMLTGTPPFTGRAADVLEAAITDPVPPIRPKRRDCPPWLEAMVMSMLSKHPGQRAQPGHVMHEVQSQSGMDLQDPQLEALDVQRALDSEDADYTARVPTKSPVPSLLLVALLAAVVGGGGVVLLAALAIVAAAQL